MSRCPHGPGVLLRKLVQFGSVARLAATIRFKGYPDRGATPQVVRRWIWELLPEVAPHVLRHGGNRNPNGYGGRGNKTPR